MTEADAARKSRLRIAEDDYQISKNEGGTG